MTVEQAVKLIAHPTRVRVLRELRRHDGEMSVRELAAALDEQLENLAYHVRTLAAARAIVESRTAAVRGAVAHFYVVAPEAVVLLDALDAFAAAVGLAAVAA